MLLRGSMDRGSHRLMVAKQRAEDGAAWMQDKIQAFVKKEAADNNPNIWGLLMLILQRYHPCKSLMKI